MMNNECSDGDCNKNIIGRKQLEISREINVCSTTLVLFDDKHLLYFHHNSLFRVLPSVDDYVPCRPLTINIFEYSGTRVPTLLSLLWI